MDKNNERIEDRIRKQAELRAGLMMCDIMIGIVPDEDKAIFQLPKCVIQANDSISKILHVASELTDREQNKVFSTSAVEFLTRVNEAVEEFIAQNDPRGGENND